jgi:hypothetical protein
VTGPMTATTRPAAATATATARRHDLDWLRVVAVLAVFVFHAAHPQGRWSGSPLAFLAAYWRDLGAGVWHLDRGIGPAFLGELGYHLWFLGFLFAFSLLGLPVFAWLEGAGGRRLVARLAARPRAGIPVKLAVVLAGSFAVTAALCGLVGRARVLGALLGARAAGGGR